MSFIHQVMRYTSHIKRFLDVAVSVVLLLTLSWLFVLVTLAYLLSFEFPVFFKQTRIGKNERLFELIKFRTLKNSTNASIQQRRFFLGDLLRSASLDELPQLWNVVRGDMSLIGPRPLPVQYLSLFSTHQRTRHCVHPGITGLAQVSGRHSISWKEKFEFDIYYAQNVSIALDFKIFLRTIVLLLSFKKDTSLSEEPFKSE
jgi:lipopolysaccharide/colanic/teichoic acid biosynthesis glycosyltransferase